VSSATDADDPTSGKAALVEALDVVPNARRGFAFGVVVTVAIFVFFVVIPGVSRSPLYYVALAVVLASGLGGLATAVLTLRSAYRLSHDLD